MHLLHPHLRYLFRLCPLATLRPRFLLLRSRSRGGNLTGATLSTSLTCTNHSALSSPKLHISWHSLRFVHHWILFCDGIRRTSSASFIEPANTRRTNASPYGMRFRISLTLEQLRPPLLLCLPFFHRLLLLCSRGSLRFLPPLSSPLLILLPSSQRITLH